VREDEYSHSLLFLKISSSLFANPSRITSALANSILPWFVTYPPILGSSAFQILMRVSMAPSRISKLGR